MEKKSDDNGSGEPAEKRARTETTPKKAKNEPIEKVTVKNVSKHAIRLISGNNLFIKLETVLKLLGMFECIILQFSSLFAFRARHIVV